MHSLSLQKTLPDTDGITDDNLSAGDRQRFGVGKIVPTCVVLDTNGLSMDCGTDDIQSIGDYFYF